ncbi:MAG TPA: LuxR C-terminal-related transcriptional regulator [Miltoncostaeaceae bacterium]|nr:LuxR C-terminal-related transcriptional regulator [Miltoncostaeaceae bacterium]
MSLLSAGRADDARREVAGAVAALDGATRDALVAGGDLPTAVPWAALAVEDLDAAVRTGGRVAEAARRRGDGTAAVGPAAAAVVALSLLGRIGEALAAADEVEQAARVTGRDQAVQWALWLRAWTRLEAGDLDGALADAEESAALADRLDASVLGAIARAVLGAVLVARGEHDRAIPLLAAYDADPGWVCRWTPWLVDALLAAGRARDALGRAAAAETLATGLGLAGCRAAAARAAAAVALEYGDVDAAAGHADVALQAARRVGGALDAARARLLAGRAWAGDDRTAAIAALEEAWRGADACGARRVRDQAVRELRRLGRRVGTGGPRAVGDTGVASLSRREREIADLVAAGLTNRQIGGRIHLSEKTVETHLSRVFAKLGVRGRAAVAARIAQEAAAGPG